MIGGEEGTSPKKIKLFVNRNNPGFEMSEEQATQEIDCIENPDGSTSYVSQVIEKKFQKVNHKELKLKELKKIILMII